MKNKLTIFDEEGINGVSNLFDDIFGAPFIRGPRYINKISTDIKETDKDYTLEMELPGIERESIDMQLKEGTLTVSVNKEEKQEETDEKGGYIRRERRYGSISRSFYVGKDISEDDISATLKNGVLSVVVPKKEPQQPKIKKIEIK